MSCFDRQITVAKTTVQTTAEKGAIFSTIQISFQKRMLMKELIGKFPLLLKLSKLQTIT